MIPENTSNSWRAGAAATIITPSVPMWLAGWAVRREPGRGTTLDLHAKALALEDPRGQRVVIATADLIALPASLSNRVAEKIRKKWRLERSQLLFNASHTHNGPEVRPDKVPFFDIPPEFADRIEPYVAALQEKLETVISTALQNLQPAILGAHQTQVSFPHNRRDANGPVDPDVPVLDVRRLDGKVAAILFGCACHNLTLSPSFCQFHGDYAGCAQAFLEQAFPGSVALFMAGAGADQEPQPRGTQQLAEQHGEALADAVQKSIATPGREVDGKISTGFELVPLDFAPLPGKEILEADAASAEPLVRRKAKFLLECGGSSTPAAYPSPVQVWHFGTKLLLIALAGEPVADYAVRFKSDFRGPLVWVAGYSNDMFGYLPTRRILREGGYEGGRALLWSALPGPFEETVEERIIQAVHKLSAR